MIQWDFTKLDAERRTTAGVFMQRFKEHFDILGDRYIHFVADG